MESKNFPRARCLNFKKLTSQDRLSLRCTGWPEVHRSQIIRSFNTTHLICSLSSPSLRNYPLRSWGENSRKVWEWKPGPIGVYVDSLTLSSDWMLITIIKSALSRLWYRCQVSVIWVFGREDRNVGFDRSRNLGDIIVNPEPLIKSVHILTPWYPGVEPDWLIRTRSSYLNGAVLWL